MTDKAKILGRIKKLLRLAADPASPNEAALAAVRAQELLFRHKLSLIEVEAASAEDIIEIRRLPIKEQWRRLLAANLCRYSYCRLLAAPDVFIFIGSPHDVEIVLYLYTYLSRTLARLSREAWQRRVDSLTDPRLGPHPVLKQEGHEAQWRGSFFLGAVETIVARLEAAKRVQALEAATASPVTAADGVLVPVSRSLARAQEKVDAYVDGKYQTRDGEQPVVDDFRLDGFVSGENAGRRVPLNKGMAGPGPARGVLR